ncbi:hypothetical protein CCP2SC5_2340002 [Azospirillaceae bacterium]
MELSINFAGVIRFLEELARRQGQAIAEETKPPVTLEELARLERSMARADLSPFLFNQAVINIAEDAVNEAEYFELYISIRLLQERMCPEYSITSNQWLFNYFTSNLDQSVLRALSHGMSFMRGRRIGININLATAMSTGFVKFDERLPPEFRGHVVLEISKVDLLENLSLYHDVADFARDRDYQISVDGLNPFWIANFDFEYLGCDYAKLYWTNELLEMDEAFRQVFLERISEQNRCRFILARCDQINSLVYARRAGIHLVQGRAVDNILRKGVMVREAISAAEGPTLDNPSD